MKRKKRHQGRDLMFCSMLFYFLAFFLLALKDYSVEAFLLAFAVPSMILLGTKGLPKLFHADRLLLSLTNFLCGLSVLVLFRLNKNAGLTQAFHYLVGIVAMVIMTLFTMRYKGNRWLTTLIMLLSLLLLIAPLAIGKEKYGAKNWINLFGFGFQPSELVKILLLFSLAFCLFRHRVFLSILYAGACLLLLMLQKDLGTGLLYFATTLILLYVTTGSKLLIGSGVFCGGTACIVGYQMFSHVKKRVSIWIDPWADPQGTGYQIVQGLIAIANGGLFGVGLGVGNGYVIPFAQNDFIFPVIVNEFGMIFGCLILVIYLGILLRGIAIANQSRNIFYALLAMGCVAFIGIQTFVIIGGNIKLIPLTGVNLPFISSGGTSMVSALCLIGILQGVFAQNAKQIEEDERIAVLEVTK